MKTGAKAVNNESRDSLARVSKPTRGPEEVACLFGLGFFAKLHRAAVAEPDQTSPG